MCVSMSTRVRSLATSLASGAAELSLVVLLRGLGTRAVITFAVVQLLGAAITFTLNKRWVFDAAETGSIAAELSRSAPVLAGAFALNTALPSVGTSVIRMPAVIAYLVSQTLVYLLWSFPLNRRWVFRVTKSWPAPGRCDRHHGDMAVPTLYPRSHYVHEVRPALPDRVFAPARGRLLRVPLHLAMAVLGIVAIARGWLPWPLVPLASLAIGINFACLTFVAHEALHGGITRARWLQHAAGWLGFLPFLVSPRLWTAWHNRDHHAHAQMPDDPDGYPTLDRYLARMSTRFSVDRFALGGRRWRGVLSLVLGFTVQSADQLFTSRALKPRERRRAYAESAAMLAVWVGLALAIGLVPFVFAYVLPLLVANACVMVFIVTNHSLSPRVEIDDPLVSSLSVTTSRLVDWLTLGFGYHVEHHLFPAMSTRHAPAVRDQLVARWPERYHSMPLTAALSLLHRTGRVYKHETTLFDPATAREYPTLVPRLTA
jgi:fatty acid desaturase